MLGVFSYIIIILNVRPIEMWVYMEMKVDSVCVRAWYGKAVTVCYIHRQDSVACSLEASNRYTVLQGLLP